MQFSPISGRAFLKGFQASAVFHSDRTVCTNMSVGHWWNDTDRGRLEALGEEPVLVPLCPPQISDSLTWNRNLVSTMTGLENLKTKIHLSYI